MRRLRGPAISGERGAALLCALMVTMLLSLLAASLVMVTTTEIVVAAQFRVSQGMLYAADAGATRVVAALRPLPNWSIALAGGCGAGGAALCDAAPARAPDGVALNLAGLTVRLRAESTARFGRAPDAPVWTLLASGPLDRLVGAPVTAPPYVAVWVADDRRETDHDAARDSNGVVMIHAEAYGVRGARGAVEMTVARTGGGIRLITWRQVR
jgi:hypothetical protein